MAAVYLVGQDGIRLSHPEMLKTASEYQARLYPLANKPNYAAISTQMESMLHCMNDLQKNIYWSMRSGTTNDKSAGHAMACDELLEWGLNRYVQTKMAGVLTKSINHRMGVLADRDKRLKVFNVLISNVPESTNFTQKFTARTAKDRGRSSSRITTFEIDENEFEGDDTLAVVPATPVPGIISNDTSLLADISRAIISPELKNEYESLLYEQYTHKRSYFSSSRERRICIALNENLIWSNNTVSMSIRHNIAVAFEREEMETCVATLTIAYNIVTGAAESKNDTTSEPATDATDDSITSSTICTTKKDFNMNDMPPAVLLSDANIFEEAEFARHANFTKWRRSCNNYINSNTVNHLRVAEAPNRRKFWDLYQIGLICKIDQWHWTMEHFDNTRKKIVKMLSINKRDSKRVAKRQLTSVKILCSRCDNPLKTQIHGGLLQFIDLKLMEKDKFRDIVFINLPLNQVIVPLLNSLLLNCPSGGVRSFKTRGKTKEEGPQFQNGISHLITTSTCFLNKKWAYKGASTMRAIAKNIIVILADQFKEVPSLKVITWCFDDLRAISSDKSFFGDTLPGGEN